MKSKSQKVKRSAQFKKWPPKGMVTLPKDDLLTLYQIVGGLLPDGSFRQKRAVQLLDYLLAAGQEGRHLFKLDTLLPWPSISTKTVIPGSRKETKS